MFSSNNSQVANDAVFVEDIFSNFLYTGNGSTQTITNGVDLATKGGMVWLKYRSGSAGSTYHHIYDSERGKSGNTSYNYLYTNVTSPQGTGAYGPTSFNTDGFSLNDYLNESSIPYVGWTFRKQPKFFDVVTYTGDGADPRTVAHNLGSVPGCIIVKNLTRGTFWPVYHRSLFNSDTRYLKLNTTDSLSGYDPIFGAAPTSTEFTVNYYGTYETNASGDQYVAYLFAHNAGGFGLTGTDNVISCGSFTTGTGFGAFDVSLGWEPQWVLIKRTDSATGGDWRLLDTMRGFNTRNLTGDAAAASLYPNTSQAEEAGGYIGPYATGFSSTYTGTASATYIYIAIRRGPMKVPTDATTVFKPISSSASTGTTQTTNFPVDMQWLRTRDSADAFYVIDRLRGISTTPTTASSRTIYTTSNSAEGGTNTSNGWNNTGFNIPSQQTGASTIYESFRRAPSFFDEVCFFVSGSVPVNHNLGVSPELIIYKTRGSADNWWTFANVNGTGQLDDAGAWFSTGSGNGLTNIAQVTSTTFKNLNGIYLSPGNTVVAYLFATCAGVSKVGKYTGTGTTKQIDCGFTGGARFVLIKRTDASGDWYVWDSARGIVSGNDPYLLTNTTAAEVTNTDYIDPYSAGFEISSSAPSAINASGGTFIFLAIA